MDAGIGSEIGEYVKLGMHVEDGQLDAIERKTDLIWKRRFGECFQNLDGLKPI